MKVVPAKLRKRGIKSAKTHARLRHDWATWHEDHLEEALAASKKKLPFVDKSKFDSARIIDEAIDRSIDHIAHFGRNGRHVVVFDMGYEIGFDARANRRTSCVTVVLEPDGTVVTAHPGLPSS